MRIANQAMAAMLVAVSSVSAVTVDDEAAAKYNDQCYFCIENGYLFCSDDGEKGVCYDASCEQDVLTGDKKKEERGNCNLRSHNCSGSKARYAFADCKAPA